MVSVDATVRVRDGVLFSPVGAEAVVLNLETGTYFGLNGTGARMWTALAEAGEVRAALARLRREYEQDAPAQLEADLLALVGQCATHGLLEVAGAGDCVG